MQRQDTTNAFFKTKNFDLIPSDHKKNGDNINRHLNLQANSQTKLHHCQKQTDIQCAFVSMSVSSEK
jgi:hypothetical protein